MSLLNAVQIDQELLSKAMQQIDFESVEKDKGFVSTFFYGENAAAAAKYLETGEFFESIGNLRRARVEYARAIQLDNSQPDYHQRLAELSFAIGDIDAAIIHIQDAIKADGNNPILRVRAGTAYKRKAERVSLEQAQQWYEFAQNEYQLAAKEIPDDPELNVQWARLIIESEVAVPGNGAAFEFARTHLRQAIKEANKARDKEGVLLARYDLARLYANQGDIDEAIAELEDLLKADVTYLLSVSEDPNFESVRADPEFSDLKTNLPKLEESPVAAGKKTLFGFKLIRQGRLEDAAVAFRVAVQLDPDSAVHQFYLGRALHAMGRYEESIEALGHSIKLDSGFTLAYCELAATYEVLRLGNDARDNWEICGELTDDPYTKDWVSKAVDRLTSE